VEFRSLRWWSDAQLSELTSRLEATWLHWQKAWIEEADIADTSCNVTCQLAHESAINPEEVGAGKEQNGWQPLLAEKTDEKNQIWMRTSKNFNKVLQAMLFNPSALRAGFTNDEMKNATFALDVAEKAWNDLLSALGILLKISGPAPFDVNSNDQSDLSGLPACQNKPWSGAVRFTVTYRSMSFELQIPADRVAMLLQLPRPHTKAAGIDAFPITPLRHALNTQRIGIRAQLASLELDLGSLQSLAIGNVIPLPHSLDQPLRVISENDVLLCVAHLVQHEGARALELSRASESILH
jgi:hypothetical protein